MSRQPRAGGTYVAPLRQSDGVILTNEAPAGVYTLAANTTYHYVIGGPDASRLSIQITGYTAGMVITSATVKDTNHSENDVPNTSIVVGEWITEDPSAAFVAVDGTGWSVTSVPAARTTSSTDSRLMAA